MEVRLDSVSGPVISSIQLPRTGGWDKFKTFTSELKHKVTGKHAQSYTKTNLGIKTQINSTDVEIQFYGPSTVRVLKYPVGKTFEKKSLSVVKTPQAVKFAVKQQGDIVSLKSNKLKVDINIKSGKISYYTLSGEQLLSEKESGAIFTDFNDAGSKTYTINQLFTLDKDEDIYGLGQQQRGKLSLRNSKLNMGYIQESDCSRTKLHNYRISILDNRYWRLFPSRQFSIY